MLNFKILSIMKARLLKITLSFAMIFIAAGAFAQQQMDDPYDYDMPSFQASGDTEDSLTVNTSIPYFIDPDPVINSLPGTYDTSATNASQGIVTSFDWTANDIGGNSSSISLSYSTFPSADTSAVAILTTGGTATSGDADTLEVYEYNPGVGCPGPVRQVPVRTFAAPSFDVSDNDVVDTIEVCSGSDVTLTLQTVADNGIAKYGTVDFLMDTSVANVSGNDYSNVTTGIDNATDYVLSKPESAALTGGNFDLFTRNLVAQDGDTDGDPEVTRYTYTFKGMNDHISRKSDFYHLPDQNSPGATDFTFYGPSGNDDAVVYVVFPTPQTGDVYYVPNDFDL